MTQSISKREVGGERSLTSAFKNETRMAHSSERNPGMSEQEVPSAVSQRIIIKFLTAERVSPSEIFSRLQAQFGRQCLSQARVYSWAKEFREGREQVENQPHPRRPRTSITPENVERVELLILDNRRITIREISEEVGISVGSVEDIVKKDLHFSKVSARWIPRILTTEHRQKRVEICQNLLQRYTEEGDTFLESILTCDETWVHYSTPESKRASM